MNTGGADGFFILTQVTPTGGGLCHVINDQASSRNGTSFEGDIEEKYLVPLIKDYTKTHKRIEIQGFDVFVNRKVGHLMDEK